MTGIDNENRKESTFAMHVMSLPIVSSVTFVPLYCTVPPPIPEQVDSARQDEIHPRCRKIPPCLYRSSILCLLITSYAPIWYIPL